MHESVRVCFHGSAREERKIQAQEIAARITSGVIYPLFYPMESIPEEVKTVIAVGGDGTIRSVTEELMKGDEQRNLLVVGGGSQNGFWRSLKSEGVVLIEEEINNFNFDSLPDFHPGSIRSAHNEDQYIFNHTAEFGNPLIRFTEINEGLRTSKIPRTMRLFVTIAKLLIERRQDDLRINQHVDVFATGHNMGSMKIFSNQSLYDDFLTRVSIQNEKRAELLRKFLIISAHLITKKNSPRRNFQG